MISVAEECRAEARELSAPTRRVLHSWIVSLLREHGPKTADELAKAMDENVLSIRPRVCELSADGVIVETGEKRPSVCGRPQAVYQLNAVKGA